MCPCEIRSRKDLMKIASATSEGAGRMHERKMDGRHPGEPFGLTAVPGACWVQIQGYLPWDDDAGW